MVDVPTVLTAISGSGILAYCIARLESRDRRHALEFEQAKHEQAELAAEATKTPEQRHKDLLSALALERRRLSLLQSNVAGYAGYSRLWRFVMRKQTSQANALSDALLRQNDLYFRLMVSPDVDGIIEAYGEVTDTLHQYIKNPRNAAAQSKSLEALFNFEQAISEARE